MSGTARRRLILDVIWSRHDLVVKAAISLVWCDGEAWEPTVEGPDFAPREIIAETLGRCKGAIVEQWDNCDPPAVWVIFPRLDLREGVPRSIRIWTRKIAEDLAAVYGPAADLSIELRRPSDPRRPRLPEPE